MEQRVISNDRDMAIVVEVSEEGIELTIENTQTGDGVGIVLPHRQQGYDLITALEAAVHDIPVNA